MKPLLVLSTIMIHFELGYSVLKKVTICSLALSFSTVKGIVKMILVKVNKLSAKQKKEIES